MKNLFKSRKFAKLIPKVAIGLTDLIVELFGGNQQRRRESQIRRQMSLGIYV